jgi:predicted amidohydrolase
MAQKEKKVLKQLKKLLLLLQNKNLKKYILRLIFKKDKPFFMSILNISLVQSHLEWQSKSTNLTHFEQLILNNTKTDLIILPEMFTTGFTMDTQSQAETMDGSTIQWMQELSIKTKAAITGSIIIKEGSNYFNRLIWAEPSRGIQYYDKRHLFSYANEDQYFKAGKKRCIIEYKGWRVCPLICYDLRFPVWSRNTEQYDFLIYVANWPEKRSYAWQSLLKARAIENLAYCAGVNRVGNDGNDIAYNGLTSLIQFDGKILLEKVEEEGIFNYELDKSKLITFRDRFQFLKDKDQFSI